MNTLRKIVRSVLGIYPPQGIDSEITSSLMRMTRQERESRLEHNLQYVARTNFGVEIKAAVYKRIKSGRGQILALVRMGDTEEPAPENPVLFVSKLVETYNATAQLTGQKSVDYAIWSESATPPSSVQSEWDVVQRSF